MWRLTTALALAAAAVASTQQPPLRLAVCCHPNHTDLMPIDWDGAFASMKGCGADLCRIDWGSDWDLQEDILAAADRAGVELLPVLFPPRPGDGTEQASYDAAKAYARECGERYRGRVRYFELSNELDCRCMTKWPNGGDRDGAAITDYDETLYAPIRGMLRGLAEGLRETHPEALRIIDAAGWLHFGFIDLLMRDQVPFDILAWHWYSEMGSMLKPAKSYSGEYVVMDRLAAYGKPVWITEGNARNGSLGRSEQEQRQIVMETVRSLAADGRAQVYTLYELFDEPQLLPSGGEAFYGIVHCEWALNRGWEFPGAQGSLGISEVHGRKALTLAWDFSGGGRYISANWLFRTQPEADELRLSVRGEPGPLPLLLRFVDATGQHLQLAPTVPLTGDWQEITIPVNGPWDARWAGADDGQVHQPLRGVWIGVGAGGAESGSVAVSRAECLKQGQVTYSFDFSRDEPFAAKEVWEGLREWSALGGE